MARNTRKDLDAVCKVAGLYYRTQSPRDGVDGVTRYRFFDDPEQGNSFHGPKDGLFTALALREAVAFARGYLTGMVGKR